MIYKQLGYILLAASASASFLRIQGGSCNGLKSHDSCMAASEDGEACSWCESAAVDDACYKESDAKSLPSSVFFCEYAPVSLLDMGSKYLAKVVDIVFGWGK